MQRHRHQEFIRFLNAIEAQVPAGKLVHAILDNYAVHKHPKVREWLTRHPRWTFHFTPTSASWLNAVEGFFAKLSKRRLKRGVFHSLVSLQAAINRFVTDANQQQKPFRWTKHPDQVGLSRRQNVYPADVALIFPIAKAGKPRKYHVPDQPPVAAQALLAASKWQRVSWRRGTKGRLRCLFAACRIRVADGHKHRMLDNRVQCMPGDEVWLVGERRSTGEQKYYVSNLPADTSLKMLAATIKARWVCEQAHQQLKEELGLDHFEGRSWTGLHRHALMTMIAYAFLQSRRLKAAGRKKKSRRTTATTEHAGHQASHPRSLRTPATQAVPSL